MTDSDTRPIVLITGATGNLGRSLGEALRFDYRIVGLDLKPGGTDFPVLQADFTSDASVELALRKFRDAFGSRIALGAILMAVPFIFPASAVATVVAVASGAALMVLSIRCGSIHQSYGDWNRLII